MTRLAARRLANAARTCSAAGAVLAACHGPARCGAPREETVAVLPALGADPENGEHAPTTRHLVVDQFGYPTDAAKVAIVVTSPIDEAGGGSYAPPKELELRRFADARVVFSGPVAPFAGGAPDELSGDRGGWFDFSSVTEAGDYFVYDPSRRVRSYRFSIAKDPYRGALRAAVRAFYFNRANVEKRAPWACVKERCWTLGESYLGPGQDREAHPIHAPGGAQFARDLSGGWWDAGDVNKYVTNANAAVHQLLSAFSERPSAFGDDFGIPESGNGVPDLLDEVRVELDFLAKMQPEDLGGGVLLKVGNASYGDPRPDQSRLPRFYYPAPCSSATIAAAGMFAHAALVFREQPALREYGEGLAARAARAFDFFETHDRSAACDDGTILVPGSDRSLPQQAQAEVVAAVYLFALTGDDRYGALVGSRHALAHPFVADDWSTYDPEQGDALLFYATLPRADPKVKQAILERHAASSAGSGVLAAPLERELYRAFIPRASYHWGSNMVRANAGNAHHDFALYRLGDPRDQAAHRERALGMLHYLHGENPMQLVYLTNMGAYGATASASEMFHAWFRDGDPRFDSAKTSELGPAPGYLVGGPNAGYCSGQNPVSVRCAASPLRRAPPGKVYRDFNTGWDPKAEYDRSWELTEPSIYYQSAYVKLVSQFVE